MEVLVDTKWTVVRHKREIIKKIVHRWWVVLYSCGVRPTSEIIVIVFVVSRLFYFYFYKYISCRLLLIRGNSSLDCQFPLIWWFTTRTFPPKRVTLAPNIFQNRTPWSMNAFELTLAHPITVNSILSHLKICFAMVFFFTFVRLYLFIIIFIITGCCCNWHHYKDDSLVQCCCCYLLLFMYAASAVEFTTQKRKMRI